MRFKKEVEYQKEVHEVGVALQVLMEKFAEEKRKGTAAGAAIVAALQADITYLFSAFEGCQLIGDEFKDDMGIAIDSLTSPLLRGVGALIKK